MTSKEYIESGIIESYVLGLLPEDEAREVEQKALADPEIGNALRQARETTEQLAMSTSVPPPAEWKDDILKAAKQSSSGTEKKNPVVRTITPEPAKETSERKTNWLAIAATVLLLLSLGINGIQYRNVSHLRNDMVDMEIRLATIELENQSMVTNYREMEDQLAMLHDPGTATFVMKAVEGKSQKLRADVFWNAGSEMVYLDIKSLPTPPDGMQYQLWALQSGTPVDMGVFEMQKKDIEITQMGRIAGADAFAVTLEPAGGSPQPTMEQMYVYGEPAII